MTLANLQKPESRAVERKKDKAEKAARLRAVHAFVDARDKWKCRACGARVDPNAKALELRAHRHHVVLRSAGGKDTTGNLALLCAGCHHEIHAYRLTCSGHADGIMVFSREGQSWFSTAPK